MTDRGPSIPMITAIRFETAISHRRPTMEEIETAEAAQHGITIVAPDGEIFVITYEELPSFRTHLEHNPDTGARER